MRPIIGVCAMLAMLAPIAAARAQPAPTTAPESPNVKISLDWAFQGPESAFLYGATKGEFTRRGLNVQLDRGNATTDTIVRVASGAYQFGWADIATMVKFNAENLDKPLIAVYVTGGNSPLAIVTVAGRGITKPADLAGRTLGSAAGSAAFALFNLFASATGFDPTTIHWKLLGGALREPMMVRGDVDAIAGFTQSTVWSVVELGVPSDKIIVFRYNDFGIRQYGTAFLVRPDYARANPATVRAVVAALNASEIDAIANPVASVASILARDPLANLANECLRLVDTLKTQTLTDEFKTNGLSSVNPARLEQSMDELLKAFSLPARVAADTVFDPSYLPPAAERIPPPLGSCAPQHA